MVVEFVRFRDGVKSAPTFALFVSSPSAAAALFDPSGVVEVAANRPVLWMMEPSLRDRINVDWTPGRDVRCDRSAETC